MTIAVKGKHRLIRLMADIELTIHFGEGKSDVFKICISVPRKNDMSENKVTFYLSNALND